jgi:hypothetical protein
MGSIKANSFNLKAPRYVDSSETPDEVDIERGIMAGKG